MSRRRECNSSRSYTCRIPLTEAEWRIVFASANYVVMSLVEISTTIVGTNAGLLLVGTRKQISVISNLIVISLINKMLLKCGLQNGSHFV